MRSFFNAEINSTNADIAAFCDSYDPFAACHLTTEEQTALLEKDINPLTGRPYGQDAAYIDQLAPVR